MGWGILADWDTWGVFLCLSAVNLLVLLARHPRGARLRAAATSARLRRWTRVDWLDWKPLAAVGALWFGAFSAAGILSGQYGCRATGLSDALGVLSSGRAVWQGLDPFQGVPYCGTTITVPYGLSAVLLDALGAPGGLPGICLVWGAVAIAILPLVVTLGGVERRYLGVYLATSTLFIPLVTSEFGGATNAIVPVTLLFSVYCARRGWVRGSVVAGFLATARFPAIFPVAASAGAWVRREWAALAGGVGAFALASAACYGVWGAGFVHAVFTSQLARRSFSLNLYGILLLHDALPAALWVEGLEALLVLAVVGAVFVRIRSPERAIALTIVGVAIVTPFLSYNFLLWLVPVALVSDRARWWLWGIATVGWANFNLGFNLWAWSQGVLWPAEVMDLLLTAMLLALFAELWRPTQSSTVGPPVARPPISPAVSVGAASSPERPAADRSRVVLGASNEVLGPPVALREAPSV